VIDCEFVNPLLEPLWNDWIREVPGATFFHSTQWARVLSDSYNYPLHYVVMKDGGNRIRGVFPIAEIRSWLTGRRGVCLPFSDECAPLAPNQEALEFCVQKIMELGRERRWDYLEIRGGGEQLRGAEISDEFLGHRIPMEATEALQLSRLKDTHRRNIRKAEREGVEIHNLTGPEAMDAYYALHCLTRKRHGVPPQPLPFFRLIQKHVIEAGYGFVSLARFRGQWVAGAVYFEFGAQALYKFGASNPDFQHLRANNLLMWNAILNFRVKGIRELSLGRTDTYSSGLLQFKRGWGGLEYTVAYHRIGLRRALRPRRPIATSEGLRKKLLQKLPIGFLRGIGAVTYRHFG
jgi:hypothetical protein